MGYVDDTLPGEVVRRMDQHRSTCAACAAMDTRVRRGLLIFRNHAEGIQLSSSFGSRLSSRLEEEKRRPVQGSRHFGRVGLYSVVAVGLVGLGVVVSEQRAAPVIRAASTHGPAAALPPTFDRGLVPVQPAAPPAFVASVSMGMAILPALMLSEELHTAGATQSEWLQSATWTPQEEEK